MQKQPDPRHTLALVAGYRTPFSKVSTELKGASAADLAAHTMRETLDRTGFDADKIDEVVFGCAGPDAREANVARVAALRAGVPVTTPAYTVMRNCASGMEAIVAAQTKLRAGEGDVFLIGGTESMSGFPLIMGPQLTRFFQRMSKARSGWQRLSAMAKFRPSFLKPRIAIVEGLTDPTTGLMMGHTAENVARRFGVDREHQDEFALTSHQRAAAAAKSGRFDQEIAPYMAPPKFGATTSDNGVRANQTIEALAKLRPIFDKREGDVTVGNACQVTDGAVAILAMSLARAEAEGLRPLATVRGTGRAGLDPKVMGLGPVHATPHALADAGIAFSDLSRFEINEAFSAQVLGCMKAFESKSYCTDVLGLPDKLGTIDPTRLNTNGGAIALGHPIAASGARIALTLAHEMRIREEQFGLAALCIGGGQGEALVLEACR